MKVFILKVPSCLKQIKTRKEKRKKEKKEKKNSQKSPTGQPLLPFKCLDQHFQNNLQQLKKISRIPYYI